MRTQLSTCVRSFLHVYAPISCNVHAPAYIGILYVCTRTESTRTVFAPYIESLRRNHRPVVPIPLSCTNPRTSFRFERSKGPKGPEDLEEPKESEVPRESRGTGGIEGFRGGDVLPGYGKASNATRIDEVKTNHPKLSGRKIFHPSRIS